MEISRISEITYNEFVGTYLAENLPCLLDERFTRNWKSRQEWISDGKPCFRFLKRSFGMHNHAEIMCLLFKKYKTFSVLIYSYINTSGNWKNEKLCGIIKC